MALGFIQSLTEMRSRNNKKMFSGRRAQPAGKAENFTTICEPIV
jgi:hypothetical protein